MKWVITPWAVLRTLLVIIGILLVFNVISLAVSLNTDDSLIKKAASLFDLNSEDNLPTLYATLSLFLSAFLLFYIAQSSSNPKSKKNLWLLLCFIFIFLGFDEMFSFHEVLMELIRSHFEVGGYLYFAWVIPYGIAVIVLGVLYLPFLLNLPKKIRLLFVLSGLIFVFGALGIELFEGKHYEVNGEDFRFAVFYTIEEVLEMLGIALFIYSLLIYISSYSKKSSLTIKIRAKQTGLP
ncbi:hypothetical protein [Flagellimonas allohymeniacidonis]|uniref:Uncharacterized protein n=1 Tax=Flagellimonas allohymeniacidonis TaxID=2517819 RepID=A0A4Q8QE24_9FLAO|nr:hypothetical protein [Allomuricauda hymeniacidonis]TAI47994.1 hypothetical protein EW142_15195 [Allomuricauda hymeniacidonis]